VYAHILVAKGSRRVPGLTPHHSRTRRPRSCCKGRRGFYGEIQSVGVNSMRVDDLRRCRMRERLMVRESAGGVSPLRDFEKN
jgi:hypothetical protein